MTVVLWDIDGTLVDVKGAGQRAFARALERAWGVQHDLAHITFAGGTDLGILQQLGVRGDERAFFDAMVELLEEELAARPAYAYPNAVEIVRELHALDVKQGLLTGNEERCGRIKLRSAGIDDTPLSFGAFGHEHPDRDELARLAHRRAGAGKVVVVGDTAKDIQAARAIGAVAVAVCTGHASRQSLALADHVFDDLSSLMSLLHAL